MGKGIIDSKGEIKGKLYFSFKSQRDSTFIEFSDILGRKTLLMWVSPEKITVRDLINNKYYSYNEVVKFFPFLKVLNTQNITEVVWGAEPDYKKSLKKYKKEMNRNLELKFRRKHLTNEKHALSVLQYKDQKSGDAFKVDFKSRQRHYDYINIKKLWKMLEF
tara:strand:- start:135 stop:620 length:486 start_codon:yes stop_codon:yes gene_type:complete